MSSGERNMIQRKKKPIVISAEKMALLVEKGLPKARLSHAEKIALAEGGLDEFYTIKEGIKMPSSPLDRQTIDNLMATFFPSTGKSGDTAVMMDISVKMNQTPIKVVKNAINWLPGSPEFALRGLDSDKVSFYKEEGKFTVHLEISRDCDRHSSISVILTDKAKRKLPFEVTLFQNGIYAESVHVNKNSFASFSSILSGAYSLRVSTKKGEILSVNIGLEE